MSLEALEAKIAELEKKLSASNKPKKFTDSLEIPEDATPEQFKKILADFEEHLLARQQSTVQEIESRTKQSAEQAKKEKFDKAVAEFKAKNPKIFEPGNETQLELLNTILHREMSQGKEPDAALVSAYDNFKKTVKWEETPVKPTEQKPSPTEQEVPNGSLTTPTKVPDYSLEKKGVKTERDAVSSVIAEMAAEGLTFPE